MEIPISLEKLDELIRMEEHSIASWHGRALVMNPEASERAKQDYRDRLAALQHYRQLRTGK